MAAEGSRSACASLIRKILVYVVENPDAKDTLDGINEFWLADSRVRHSKDQVRAGLEFLVESKDWLTKSKAGASVTLYGLNKDRLSEIKSFLEETGEC
jgi:hypothetical protein